jgi:AcrR family transcriptional regulator
METTAAADSGAPGRRELRKQVTRRELLSAGRQLFSERGLYDSRMEDVAERARIAKGTLYLYFRDKDDLILAVIAASFEELRASIEQRGIGAATLGLRTERLIETHLRFLVLQPEQLRLLHQARGLLLFPSGRWNRLLLVFASHLDWIAARLGEVPEGRALAVARRRSMARIRFGSVSGLLSVQEATGEPMRALLRRPGLVPGLSALGLDEAPHRPETSNVHSKEGRK